MEALTPISKEDYIQYLGECLREGKFTKNTVMVLIVATYDSDLDSIDKAMRALNISWSDLNFGEQNKEG